jgi:hypothetical protein
MDDSETTTSQGLTYPPNVDVPNLVTCPSQTLKLAWFDVAPRMDAKKKTCGEKRLDCVLKV